MAKQKVIETVIYPIKCPHCFMEFEHDKVHFRATTARHYEVRMTNSPTGQVRENILREDSVVDTNLVNFNRAYGKATQRTNPIIDPSGESVGSEYVKLMSEGDAVKYEKGVLASVKDEFGYESNKRICPFCHNLLPKNAGYVKSYTIAFVGDTAVGKTVYMTTLINRLENLHEDFNSMLNPLTSEVNDNYYNNYYKPMYIDGVLPHHTGLTEQMEPLIYQLDMGIDSRTLVPEHSVTLSFYDVAGDGIKNADYVDARARHLHHADAFLYLVDPLQTGAALRIAALNQHAKGDFIEGRSGAMQTLKSFFVQDIQYKDKPTAIVLTKSDLLKSEDRTIGFPPESNIYQKYEHPGYLNMNEVDNINTEVENFLDQNDRQFKKHVKFSFLNVKFFAISALGGATRTEEENGVARKKIVNQSPQEIRVEEPFLWILHKLNIVGTEPNKGKKRFKFFEK